MTWREAMDRYGSDKPDVRFGLEINDVSDVVKNSGFKYLMRLFHQAVPFEALT